MNWRAAVLAILLFTTPVTEATAMDHKNLDEGRPLRVEDAYAIPFGEIAIEAGAGVRLERRGPDRGVFPIEVLYGAAPNLQIGLGSTMLTDPRSVGGPEKSGDLRLSALYNFNQETTSVPAFAAKLHVKAPTGIDSRGDTSPLRHRRPYRRDRRKSYGGQTGSDLHDDTSSTPRLATVSATVRRWEDREPARVPDDPLVVGSPRDGLGCDR